MDEVFDSKKIFIEIFEKLKLHESLERPEINVPDKTLIGYLHLLIKLFENGSCDLTIDKLHELLNELFLKCLFPHNEVPLDSDAEGEKDVQLLIYSSSGGQMKCK
jgi:hypothetical protein